MSRPPDGSEPPQSDIQRKAQYIVQLLVGVGMSEREYREKLLLIKDQLEEIYWLGYARATAKDVFRRETVKPPSPPEGWDTEIEFIEVDDEE